MMATREKTFLSWDELGDMLTAQECADFLRVHLNTVKRHLRKGDLPGKKIGRQWRIDKSDLKKFMKRK